MSAQQNYMRPHALEGETTRHEVSCTDDMFVISNRDSNGNLVEVLGRISHAGSCAAAIIDALTKVITLALTAGVPEHAFFKALTGIGCNSGESCVSALGELLRNDEQYVSRIHKPAMAQTTTYTWQTGCGEVSTTCFGTMGTLDSVLVSSVKPSTCAAAISAGLQNAITVALQHGVDAEQIAIAINGILCPKATGIPKVQKVEEDDAQLIGMVEVEVTRPSCITAIALSIRAHINPASEEELPLPETEEV